jgi:hypothetical protein
MGDISSMSASSMYSCVTATDGTKMGGVALRAFICAMPNASISIVPRLMRRSRTSTSGSSVGPMKFSSSSAVVSVRLMTSVLVAESQILKGI